MTLRYMMGHTGYGQVDTCPQPTTPLQHVEGTLVVYSKHQAQVLASLDYQPFLLEKTAGNQDYSKTTFDNLNFVHVKGSITGIWYGTVYQGE